ncbi:hypothetical protein AMIS_25830 [Actinoplanes missouriensis 431]|uniref:Uncharacterized protein n=1 Tax=Actinoplanes missouriensis (strain ATCC 14538 / DSM 43046 / CBS 188.64 / JCM 3121 / NBRC 102363 / NCIMB 12654 / NRRL B-3342 / UNCC 431) TaxID=512565 RepID=I0H466_ACTM4|nr:hypothetical protein AMIS_25830 [Actinoplanes missouriensis 431]
MIAGVKAIALSGGSEFRHADSTAIGRTGQSLSKG